MACEMTHSMAGIVFPWTYSWRRRWLKIRPLFHWIIGAGVQTAMSIKVYNSWLFWWCHPQWEFDSHSPPVRLIWWWFFARFPSSERWVHRERVKGLSPQKDFDDFISTLCFPLTVLLVSFFAASSLCGWSEGLLMWKSRFLASFLQSKWDLELKEAAPFASRIARKKYPRAQSYATE